MDKESLYNTYLSNEFTSWLNDALDKMEYKRKAFKRVEEKGMVDIFTTVVKDYTKDKELSWHEKKVSESGFTTFSIGIKNKDNLGVLTENLFLSNSSNGISFYTLERVNPDIPYTGCVVDLELLNSFVIDYVIRVKEHKVALNDVDVLIANLRSKGISDEEIIDILRQKCVELINAKIRQNKNEKNVNLQ